MNAFAALVKSDPIALDRAALLLAQVLRYPHLEIEASLAQLDAYAYAVTPHIQTLPCREQLVLLSDYLFEQVGLQGNEEDYYDPANSFLNNVLASKRGIPITLALVYIAVGERLRMPVYGVGLPGHFIVGCRDKEMTFYIDCFHQGVLLEESEVMMLAAQYLPENVGFTRDFLLPQSPRLILMRMLNNLRDIYTQRREFPLIIRTIELQTFLYPHDLKLKRDLGILHLHQSNWGSALRLLRHYLYLYPDAPDRDTIQQAVNTLIDEVSRRN